MEHISKKLSNQNKNQKKGVVVSIIQVSLLWILYIDQSPHPYLFLKGVALSAHTISFKILVRFFFSLLGKAREVAIESITSI